MSLTLSKTGVVLKKPVKSKYGNKTVVIDGLRFDSAKEARRYQFLKIQQQRGEISELLTQVKFELAPKALVAGRNKSAIRYYADFVYLDSDGKWHVEDVKGAKTDVYVLKRHLMKTVHNIDIEEV